MTSPLLILIFYSVLILVASLVGGWIPLIVRLTHRRLQVAISFVAGFMLGVGIFHMLPHAWQDLRSIDLAAWWLMAGFMVMFFIQRFFHFHHHDVPDAGAEPAECLHEHDHRGHDHGHEHAGRGDTLANKSARNLSWGGAALGLTLHTLIDGVALAASVELEARAGAAGGLLGFGTFLVIILHKPFDSLALGTLMAAGGWSKASRHIVNGLFALAIPAGALLFYFGASHFSGAGHHFLGYALAFTAGSFVCIAASDLLPELQFHSHDRIKLSVALLAGLFLSALIGRLEETGHEHRHETEPANRVPSEKHSRHSRLLPLESV